MSFKDELRKAQKELDAKLNKIMRATAIKTFNRIVVESPVDTGRFRHNWIASVNTPNITVTNNTSDDNIAAKLNSGKITDILYLTNNLPYAARIEEGWSQQAPSGWVRTAVQDAQKTLDRVVKEVVG